MCTPYTSETLSMKFCCVCAAAASLTRSSVTSQTSRRVKAAATTRLFKFHPRYCPHCLGYAERTMIAALALVLCFTLVSALRLPQPLLRRAKATIEWNPVLPAASSLLLPSAAFAADGGAVSTVSIPIAISLLTIFPFLYYANGTIQSFHVA